jgi:hypothetical protein
LITEDGGSLDHCVPIKDLLDRIELLTSDDRISSLRRVYNDRDLMSVFRLANNDELRRAVMEQNLHSVFRVLESYDPIQGTHEDLRKSILEQNLHSVFRLLKNYDCKLENHEDIRKSVLDQNLHSLFRVFENHDLLQDNYDDLRKSVLEKNLRSIFRLYEDTDDLRKAVVDQQLNSIFKLFDNSVHLRKAVVEKDLKSILTLLEQDDLSKLIFDENRNSLYRILFEITDHHIIRSLKKLEDSKIKFMQDCISRGQLRSKIWLVNQLEKIDIDLGCVFLCAGWYGTLAPMIFESTVRVEKIRSFDLDPSCEKVAEIFNKPWVIDGWKFKSVTKNILHINYECDQYKVKNSKGETETLSDRPDTVINTSCEHIKDFEKWYRLIPEGTFLVLQSNNFEDVDDHVNYCESIEKFEVQTPMKQCFFQGTLDLDQYQRFMRIGYK